MPESRPDLAGKYDQDQANVIDIADQNMSAMVWDGKPFFKGIVQHSGRPSKLWQFPQAVVPGLGWLGKVADQKEMVPMVGKVYFAPSDPVYFMPNKSILVYPDLRNGFTDGNFDGLALSSINKIQFDRLAKIMAKLESIHGLYIYNIEDADAAFESSSLQVINYYPDLTKLRVETLVDGRAVLQIRRLKMLQHLHLGAVKGNRADLFKSIHGLNRLTELYFTNVPLTVDAVKEICSCQNLEKLKFLLKDKNIQIQGFELEHLASLKKLKWLTLESVRFSPTLIQALVKFRSLKTLECQLDREWNRGQRMALRQALPDVDLLLYWQVAGEEMQRRLHYSPGQNQPDNLTK